MQSCFLAVIPFFLSCKMFSNNCCVVLKDLSLVLILILGLLGSCLGQLRVGFYSKSCPMTESVVRATVDEAVAMDQRNAARLLRIHFHDCFVEGCDGSILIDDDQLPNSENKAFAHQGLAGFDFIESAKAKLEKLCPGVVSCSDIVALTARDAVTLSNGPHYDVPTGRRDGRVSNSSLADNMPDVDDSIETLLSKFKQKGLSYKDLVLLSAAHTIGTTACFFMSKRLYAFTPSGGSDPSINPIFLPKLKATCPAGGDNSVRLPLDFSSEFTFDDHLLRNIKNGFAVIASDARLYDNTKTKRIIDSYVANVAAKQQGGSFMSDFAASMVKMGKIGVKTGSNGEIRRVCHKFN